MERTERRSTKRQGQKHTERCFEENTTNPLAHLLRAGEQMCQQRGSGAATDGEMEALIVALMVGLCVSIWLSGFGQRSSNMCDPSPPSLAKKLHLRRVAPLLLVSTFIRETWKDREWQGRGWRLVKGPIFSVMAAVLLFWRKAALSHGGLRWPKRATPGTLFG